MLEVMILNFNNRLICLFGKLLAVPLQIMALLLSFHLGGPIKIGHTMCENMDIYKILWFHDQLLIQSCRKFWVFGRG